MPVSLIPDAQTRRSFLKTSVAGACSTTVFSWAERPDTPPPPWYALLADTHIDALPETNARGINMAAHLKSVVGEILAEPTSPQFVLINGDCAYLKGLKQDYRTLRPLLQPLLDKGIPVHLTMGNHDDRGPFFELFPEAVQHPAPSKTHHLVVIETPLANWFLLDTLQIVNKVTGELGQAQRDWIAAEIDQRGDTPAILVGHHNPQVLPEGSTKRITGIADTRELMELWQDKPQVKAYLYGHTHNYSLNKDESNVHLLNQPPVAYVFDGKRPNGWLRAELKPGALITELRALDKQHPQHGESCTLTWR